MFIEIPLSRNQVAIIDSEDAGIVRPYRWRYIKKSDRRTGYARGYLNNKNVAMHRLIIGALDGQIVDHINGDGLDNRKVNLRLCNRSENSFNSTIDGSPHGFRGVGIAPGHGLTPRYRARITINGKSISGPCRMTALEAAHDYDRLAIEHAGEFARLNFRKPSWADTQRAQDGPFIASGGALR